MLRQSRSKVTPSATEEDASAPHREGNDAQGPHEKSSFVAVPFREGAKPKASPSPRKAPSEASTDEGGGCCVCGVGKKSEKRRLCGCTKRAFSDFMQQRMHAWQPVLSPQRIVGILGIGGLVLLALGILILVTSNNILECKVDYTDAAGVKNYIKVDSRDCTDTSVTELTGTLYFFYELTNFYQNHRRYLKSRSDSQLQGKVYTEASEVKTACDPRYLADDGRVLDPCGLNALSVFTDSFSLHRKRENDAYDLIPLDESRETICWHFDLNSRFKNPSPEERKRYEKSVDFWLFEPEMRKALHMDIPGVGEGVENSHFIVWMREAALPTFRKVYGKIEETPLKLPIYVNIEGDTYDVRSFGGRKYVVISQASWLGGRNSFLGIAYLVVACVCLVVCLILLYAQMRNPRHMGDILWLRKALYGDA
ncbi:LEM3 (ligand-effect modulator 3) family / CDC50 family protein [Besnoitia besnoiti]|uniref:LEM3 (Ligand-effect modulator 3) family / CDC50 family protein n=1 Tax=Besnoitia besnoiti TaxID=94643 RepID=A0A2A9M3H3_BESBE|nr:LEM3 (ligand-effect modulator 3) family / CDC50 family protein [Besnoitia besnoiti]PFH33038.1 LEM3 (ligand-effect modulator 3) family / CDC50 family protein [Besnoitia besnoiti]